MKNKLTLVLILMMTLTVILAGCSSGKTAKIEKYSDLQGKVIGVVSSPASNESLAKILSKYLIGADPKEVIGFDRASDCNTAIIAGKIDATPVAKYEADYIVKRNSDLAIVEAKQKLPTNIVMVLRGEEKGLKEDLDKAFATLQENGTLALLEDKWITNLPATGEPSKTETALIAGAKTVYVGVTGAYAPLDYIGTDGKPAGYNVALLTEVGKLLNINFQFVSIEPSARYSALESKKIDMIFCQIYNNEMASLFTGKYIMTNPYFTDKELCFLVRK
ncbi:MAG: transporter substrate-binding domain-containing protein [Syntrophomonas sp.]